MTTCDLDYLRQRVCDALDAEFLRISSTETQQAVLTSTLDVVLTQNLHMFFSNRNLADLSERMFAILAGEFRDYVLNVSARLFVELSLDNVEAFDLIRCLSRTSALVSDPSKASPSVDDYQNLNVNYTPDPVRANLTISVNHAISILSNNAWLVTILCIVLFFKDTQTYQQLIQKQKG